ncbi:MAG: IPT/TIG domain-containing protein, partial [Actinomycetota bacterium]|nr:IPT/TIG domain-containing protein [Actinomycetota bacterium]
MEGEGGGIWVNTGSLQVANSTLSGNQAIIDGEGGAIGEGQTGDFVALIESTVSGNTTTDSSTSSASFTTLDNTSGGGAIFSFGTTSVVDSTIANNSAGDSSGSVTFGGGGGVLNQGTAEVAGSVISENTSAGSGNNCSSVGTAVTDEGYNFSAGSSCGFAAANHGADAATLSLGVLGPNGGPSALVTDTIALQGTGSADAAVGAIAPSALATVAANGTGTSATVDLCGESATTSENSFLGVSLASDQRGVARSASACDAGAFEQSSSQTTITSTSPASPVAGDAVSVAVSVGSPSPATAPSGSVTVTASGSDSGTCTALLTSGSGSCSITFPTAGSVSLSAAYAPGDAVASSTSGSVTVASVAPTVTGISPSSGPAAGGTTVTVSGTNLSGEIAIDFGTTAAASA